MNIKELRDKTKSDLEESLLDLRREQFNLRMQQGTDQLTRPSEMKRVRREIARVKTILNEVRAGAA